MRSIQKLTDSEITNTIKGLRLAGDATSLKLAKCIPLIVVLLKRRIKNRPLEIDDLQLAIIDALEAIKVYDPNKGHINTIIGTYVNNGIADRFRRETRECRNFYKTKFAFGNPLEIVRSIERDVSEQFDLQVRIKRLSRTAQRYLKEKFTNELNGPQIAKKYGCTRAAVNKTIDYAINRLKQELQAHVSLS